jgi:transcriptional regulator with XRE-family HTH domain
MESQPIGERIRAARLEKKMTQDELARDTFSKSYVSAVELGKIQPSIKALRILARRLGLPASFFLETLAPDIEAQQALLVMQRLRLLVAQGGHEEEALTELGNLDRERLNEAQVAEALYLEGKALSALQRDADALARLEQSKTLWEELEENEWVERIRNVTGEIYFRQRKFFQAQDQHRTNMEAVKEGKVNDIGLKISIYANLALVYSTLDLHDAARALFQEASDLADAASSLDGLVKLLDEISAKYLAEEKYAAAREALEKACAALETLEVYQRVTNLRLVFGQVYAAGHNWDEAETCYKAALAGAVLALPTEANITALTNLAKLYLRQNRLDEALHAANEARAALERNVKQSPGLGRNSHTPHRAEGEIVLTLARISEKKEEVAQADNYFQEALELLKFGHDSELLSSAYFSYGEALLARGDAQRGAQYLKLAYEERKVSSQ